jgi:hypothetical protein
MGEEGGAFLTWVHATNSNYLLVGGWWSYYLLNFNIYAIKSLI